VFMAHPCLNNYEHKVLFPKSYVNHSLVVKCVWIWK